MSRKFWLVIVALLVLMLALEYQMPRRFQWEPTFAHADRQPFGCYVFDSIFAQEMAHGYTVCRKSLSQLALQDTTPRSIVILRSGYQDVNVDTMLSLAHRGCRILYSPTYLERRLCDTLHIGYNYHSTFDLKSIQGLTAQYDSIYWTGDNGHYKPTVYRCYKQLIHCVYSYNDSVPAIQALAFYCAVLHLEIHQYLPVALSRPSKTPRITLPHFALSCKPLP